MKMNSIDWKIGRSWPKLEWGRCMTVGTGRPGVTIMNWASSFEFAAASLHHPESVEEAQEIVAAGTRVKALGTRHSFTDVADSPGGTLIALDRMPQITDIHCGAGVVSCNSGITYSELAAQLEARGWALPNLASLPHISVAGATATATHGSGDGNGVLSTSLSAIELIRGDGSLMTIDVSASDFAALAVGLGAFGLFTRLELEVEPSFTVQQQIYRSASWDRVIDHLDEVMASAYSVCLLGDIGATELRSLWIKHRTEDIPREFPNELHGGVLIGNDELRPGHALTTVGGVIGPWSERLAHFRPDAQPSVGGDELQSEYFVDRRHGAAALEALRRMGDRISPHLHGMEIRSLAADELWLSPAYQRPSLCLGFTWRKHPEEVHALLPAIEEALAEFDPRPHWGKLFAMNDVAPRFPKFTDFMELREHYDPDRKFWNPFLERIAATST